MCVSTRAFAHRLASLATMLSFRDNLGGRVEIPPPPTGQWRSADARQYRLRKRYHNGGFHTFFVIKHCNFSVCKGRR